MRQVKTKLLALLLVAGATLLGEVSIGIRIGPPPPQRVMVVPRSPGPEFFWVEGYWYPVGNHYKWHDGYWTRPPYPSARWIAPRHDGERFFEGYWEGERGRRDHDHHWDRDHDRDFRDHDRGRDYREHYRP